MASTHSRGPGPDPDHPHPHDHPDPSSSGTDPEAEAAHLGSTEELHRRRLDRDDVTLGGVGRQLVANLTSNWWVLLLRGGAAILFGVMAWLWPGLSIVSLILLFGAFALADGVLALWGAIRGPRENQSRWLLALWGVVGVLVGVFTFFAPGLTAASLLVVIAVWAVAKGVLEIATAIRLRKEIEGEWLLILGGIASVAFGVLLAFRPGAGALALVWLIATYAVVFGALMVMLAFKVRSWGHRAREGHAPIA